MSSADWHTVPTLRGEHVLLRPTVLDDTPALARAYDIETTRYFLYGSESGPPTGETMQQALSSGRQVLTQVDAATAGPERRWRPACRTGRRRAGPTTTRMPAGRPG